MGKDSAYIKQKNNDKLKKLKALESKLPSYVSIFLEDKRRSCQISSAISYAYNLIVFFEYLKSANPKYKDIPINKIPEKDLNKLTSEDINEYQDYLELSDNHNNSNSSIKTNLSAIKSFFTYELKHNYLKKDPTIGMSQRQKQKEHDIIRLTSQEVSKLLNTVYNSSGMTPRQIKLLEYTKYRDIAIIMLLLGTGIRVSELVGLDINDVNFEERSILVVRKGGKGHTVYFNEEVALTLKDYIDFERPKYILKENEPALFLSNRKKRMAIRTVQEMVTKFSKVAIPNKHITVHKMRSTYGTALYKKTNDIRLVADVLGHSDINTTAKHYAALEEEHRKQAGKLDLYD